MKKILSLIGLVLFLAMAGSIYAQALFPNSLYTATPEILDSTLQNHEWQQAAYEIEAIESSMSPLAAGGWTGAQIANGAISSAHLVSGIVNSPTLFNNALCSASLPILRKKSDNTGWECNSITATALTSGAITNLNQFANGLCPNAGEAPRKKVDNTGWECAVAGSGGGVSAHSALTGLSADDHTQYMLLAGRATGQTLQGGPSGFDLTLAGDNNYLGTGKVVLTDYLVTSPSLSLSFSGTFSGGLIQTPTIFNDLQGTWNSGADAYGLDVSPTFALTGNVSNSSLAMKGANFAPSFNTSTFAISGDATGIQMAPSKSGAGTVQAFMGARNSPSIAAGSSVLSYGYLALGTISSGASSGDWYDFADYGPTGSGTITGKHVGFYYAGTSSLASPSNRYALYVLGGNGAASVHVPFLGIGSATRPTVALDVTGDVNVSGTITEATTNKTHLSFGSNGRSRLIGTLFSSVGLFNETYNAKTTDGNVWTRDDITQPSWRNAFGQNGLYTMQYAAAASGNITWAQVLALDGTSGFLGLGVPTPAGTLHLGMSNNSGTGHQLLVADTGGTAETTFIDQAGTLFRIGKLSSGAKALQIDHSTKRMSVWGNNSTAAFRVAGQTATDATLRVVSDTGAGDSVSLTTGTLISATGVWAPTAGGTQRGMSLALTNAAATNFNTFKGLDLTVADTSSLANTDIGLSVDLTGVTNVNAFKRAATFVGGNVGIGTLTPSASQALDVVGDASVSGILTAGEFRSTRQAANGGQLTILEGADDFGDGTPDDYIIKVPNTGLNNGGFTCTLNADGTIPSSCLSLPASTLAFDATSDASNESTALVRIQCSGNGMACSEPSTDVAQVALSIGTGSTQVAAGNHVHTFSEVTGASGALFVRTSDSSAVNTCTSACSTLTNQSIATPPSSGKVYRVSTAGKVTMQNGSDTFGYKVSLGGTVVCDTTAVMTTSTTPETYIANFIITVRTSGSSASVKCAGTFQAATWSSTARSSVDSTPATIDLDGTPAISLTTAPSYSVSNAGNTMTESTTVVEALN